MLITSLTVEDGALTLNYVHGDTQESISVALPARVRDIADLTMDDWDCYVAGVGSEEGGWPWDALKFDGEANPNGE